MKTINPLRIEAALLPAGTPTFDTVISKLLADDNLKDLRRRDMVSGLHRVAKALGRSPDQTIADPTWLQPRLSKVAPAALGLSAKSWQNAVSDARAAMVHVGIVGKRRRHMHDLSPSWCELWQAVLDSKDRTLLAGLGRFVHFLNNLSLAPDEVTQEHADAFLQAVMAEEIAKRPEVAWRDAVNAWNLAGKRIAGWPSIKLHLPKWQNVIRLPDQALPQSFLADLDAMLHRSAAPDPFAEEVLVRALAPATIKHRASMLKRFVSELLLAGVAEVEVSSVAAICAPDLAERGLRAMVARRGGAKSVVIDGMAGILLSCARRLGMDEKTLAALTGLAKRVAIPSQRGMTRKNRERLRVLRDDATLRRLLQLPDRLWALGDKLTPSKAALAREDALAIAILSVCPLRIKNIAGIRLDVHLHRPGDGRVFLVFGEDEIKNDRPVEFELPPGLCRMLDKHLALRSPLLCPAGTPWLFPRRSGTDGVDPCTLSTRLKERIFKETGIVMNAHLFRHLAAMLYLEANPGAYEAVRRLLGHSSVSKTISLYTGLETRSVFEAFGQVLTDKKGRK